MKFQYVPINSIFSKLIRDATDTFNEDDVIEWCGEALEFIGAVSVYEEAIAFIEITNHQGKLPLGLHKIIQVARNNQYTTYKNCTPLTVCQEAPESCGLAIGQNPCVCPPSDAVWLDCNGQPIVAYDIAYYRPYFDLKTEFKGWSNSSYYRKNFSPVRLANHTLFNTLVTPEQGVGYTQSVDSYNIVLNNIVRTSFKEGQLCLAYYRQVRDKDNGYPMIPDDISYRTAITKYIQMKMADREFQNGRDGAERRLAKYEADWQWYCGQAGDKAMMPSGIDEYQNLLDQRLTLIPNYTKYYGFFGNLSRPEAGYPNSINRDNSIYNQDKVDPMYCNNLNGNNSIPIIPVNGNNGKNPVIKTVTGDKLVLVHTTDGDVYDYLDVSFRGYNLEIFANPFNRYLQAGEFITYPEGGGRILIGGPYTITDIFKFIPNGLR